MAKNRRNNKGYSLNNLKDDIAEVFKGFDQQTGGYAGSAINTVKNLFYQWDQKAVKWMADNVVSKHPEWTNGEYLAKRFGQENLNALEAFANIFGAGPLVRNFLNSINPKDFPRAKDLQLKFEEMLRSSKKLEVTKKLNKLATFQARLPIPLSSNMKRAIEKVDKEVSRALNDAQNAINMGDSKFNTAYSQAGQLDALSIGDVANQSGKVTELADQSIKDYNTADEILKNVEVNM